MGGSVKEISMKKPTLFVNIDGQGMSLGGNPIAKAIGVIGTAFGAEEIGELVSGDVEADIAVTNSLNTALHMVKETERTTIMLAFFYRREQEAAEALAGRYPDRVIAVPYVSIESDGAELGPRLQKLIFEKIKEA